MTQKQQLTELQRQRDRAWRQYQDLDELHQKLWILSEQAPPELDDNLGDACRSLARAIARMHIFARELSTKARALKESLYEDR